MLTNVLRVCSAHVAHFGWIQRKALTRERAHMYRGLPDNKVRTLQLTRTLTKVTLNYHIISNRRLPSHKNQEFC